MLTISPKYTNVFPNHTNVFPNPNSSFYKEQLEQALHISEIIRGCKDKKQWIKHFNAYWNKRYSKGIFWEALCESPVIEENCINKMIWECSIKDIWVATSLCSNPSITKGIITNLIGKRASKLPKESIHELLWNTNYDEDCHNVLTSKSY